MDSKHQYKDILPISREDAESAFLSNEPLLICDALLRETLYSLDWQWVQDRCLEFIEHENESVSGLAIVCLGHLARIHGVLDTDRVIPILQALRSHSTLAGRVEDALDDIQIFTKHSD